MSNKTNLREYLPKIYDEVVEMEQIQDSLSVQMETSRNITTQAISDQFIQTCTEKGIVYYENIFGIKADPSNETIEMRRNRILRRRQLIEPPYTERYLTLMLNDLFGAGNYKLEINREEQTITVESSSTNYFWYEELLVTINTIKPCNMIFINRPFTFQTLMLSEELRGIIQKFNYILDGKWLLGRKPFRSIVTDEVLKMAQGHSLQNLIMNKTAEYLSTIIKKAKINDNLIINLLPENFKIDNQTLQIQYLVLIENTNITNVKLFDIDDNLLSNINVYIPVAESIEMLHNIRVQEGINVG